MNGHVQSGPIQTVNGLVDSSMAGYNVKVDELREAEYPMLHGETHLLRSLGNY